MICPLCEKDVTEWIDLGMKKIVVRKKRICPECAMITHKTVENLFWVDKNVDTKRK